MLLPPAMRDQDPQPSQPFGERKPRPEEIEAQKRAELNKAPAVGKSTNLPTPPQHINDHEMIRRDILPPSSGLIPSLEALAREVIARVFNVKPRITEDAGVPPAGDGGQRVRLSSVLWRTRGACVTRHDVP